MTTKEESLAFITELAKSNSVTREEVVDAYDNGLGQHSQSASQRMSVSDVLYFVGALIVSMGAYFLIYNNEGLSSIAKIIFTLVFGLLNFAIGAVLNSRKNLESVSFAFFLISAFLIPFGMNIAFAAAGQNTVEPGTQVVISGICLAFFFFANLLMKKNIFIFFNIIFGTWLFFAFTDMIVTVVIDWQFMVYRTMVVGLSYIFLGRFFSKDNITAPISGFLYAFGLFTFLSSAMILGGFSPEQNIFWELIFPVLVFATLFYSVTIRNKSFLVLGTLFLMAYIGKITGEYFSEGLGWPIALMVCGVLVIGSGYLFVYIKKKYSLN